MTMQLHGGPLSPFVRKVMLCIIEKGVLDQTERVRSPTAIATPNLALMEANPLSKIPTLVTGDGIALYDSDVICEYLDETFEGPRLIPAAGPDRWQVLRRTALASGAMDALVLWNFFRNQPPQEHSEPVKAALAVKINACLAEIERDVGLLTAGPFDLAAISTGCLFGYIDYRFADLEWRRDFPACADWFAGFEDRPSARMTKPYPYRPEAKTDPSLAGRLMWD